MNGQYPQGTLVIGYGNTLRGDDAVGRLLADEVSDWNLPGVRVVSTHQLTPELACDISRSERVLFMDASLFQQVGEEETVKITPISHDAMLASASLHAFAPSHLLALTALLYGGHPEGFLLTVSGAEFEHGSGLTSEMCQQMKRARALLKAWLGMPGTERTRHEKASVFQTHSFTTR